MEIERKYLIKSDGIDYTAFPFRLIEQGYLSKEPVVRVRRDQDDYYLTYKSKGLMVREEANLPLTKESYLHLLKKSDGAIIRKCRYLIPYSYVPVASSSGATVENIAQCVIELDVFEEDLAPLILAEVEFASIEAANSFVAPDWFAKEVTDDPRYQNCNLTDGLPQNV
ncbi:MAG: CYTH domain-containing protein [Lachnospiraceae bacterium]